MEEKRNYVVYVEGNSWTGTEATERVVKMTVSQAKTIEWFMHNFDVDGTIELAENYKGDEI
jgi:hypothetical protein